MDGTQGALLESVSILQRKGHQVDLIDVHGENRDPRLDNWDAPYDQVWDLRFVDRDSTTCGSGLPGVADYFDSRWRQKSVSFLNHCGKLFIAGEYYTYVDRDEGLYAFLKEVGAVKMGYDSCPPSEYGNSSTTGAAFYRVKNNLGPAFFYGDMVGGIPLKLLTGTSFVDTTKDWESDEIDRSIVSGWNSNQFGGAVTAGLCGRGRLFMVWDATMWTLWQPGKQEFPDNENPVWDDSAWEPGNVSNTFRERAFFRKARKVTSDFFPAVANWLGSQGCPCVEVMTAPAAVISPIPTKTNPKNLLPPSKSASPWIPSRSQLAVRAIPPATTAALESSPTTVLFNGFPINLYMAFRDGAGEYQLTIWDSQGRLLQTVFDRTITVERESWASWDGHDLSGREVSDSLYSVILSRNGIQLRKIMLERTN